MYVKGKEGKSNFSCYWCRKDATCIANAQTRSIAIHILIKIRMGSEDKNESGSEWKEEEGMGKLVSEVAAAVFTIYAPSDWLDYERVLEISNLVTCTLQLLSKAAGFLSLPTCTLDFNKAQEFITILPVTQGPDPSMFALYIVFLRLICTQRMSAP